MKLSRKIKSTINKQAYAAGIAHAIQVRAALVANALAGLPTATEAFPDLPTAVEAFPNLPTATEAFDDLPNMGELTPGLR